MPLFCYSRPIARVLLAITLASSFGCAKDDPPGAADLLAKARQQLTQADFGQEFDRCLAILATLPDQTDDKATVMGARLTRARALLELMLAAQLTGSQELTEQLKTALGLQLDGDLTHPRNYQILAQALLEEFRLVARESGSSPEAQRQAEALALYTMGLQGILFRSKADYFKGRDAVAAFPELAYLDNLSAVRDLIAETLDRDQGPEANWQNVVLTVIGRVCPTQAARYIARLCTAIDLTTESEEYCHSDFRKIPAGRQQQGRGYLEQACAAPGGNDPPQAGLTAIKAHYDRAFDSLLAEEQALRPTLQKAVQKMASRKAEAYTALSVFLD